jgi:hypothetical protein
LHHLLSFPSAAEISGLSYLFAPQVELSYLIAPQVEQLSYLIAPQPPWPYFFRQTWNCPSVLNLILN